MRPRSFTREFKIEALRLVRDRGQLSRDQRQGVLSWGFNTSVTRIQSEANVLVCTVLGKIECLTMTLEI